LSTNEHLHYTHRAQLKSVAIWQEASLIIVLIPDFQLKQFPLQCGPPGFGHCEATFIIQLETLKGI